MSEKDFSETDFDKFAKEFSEYLAKANESKKRGNNDYNPLKAVQNPNDEVNMHSGFLVSLLDTRGEHYQDDLFLRLFLENLKIKDCGNDENLSQWFGNTKNAQVEKECYIIDKELDEKGFIDLYINNGDKHIILENKVDSGLSYLSDDICKMTNLKSLNLIRNELRFLPDDFGKLKNLTK